MDNPVKTEQRLTQIFVELADTLVDEFDALDFLHTLTERVIELLDVDAAGVIHSDQHGHLRVLASTSSSTQDLELFELRSGKGHCLDCVRTGHPVRNVSTEEPHSVAPVQPPSPLRVTRPMPFAATAQPGDRSDESLLRRPDVRGRRRFRPRAGARRRRHDRLLQERAVRESDLIAEQLQAALNSRSSSSRRRECSTA